MEIITKEIRTKCGKEGIEIVKVIGFPPYPCLKNYFMAGRNMHSFFREGRGYIPETYCEGLNILYAALNKINTEE